MRSHLKSIAKKKVSDFLLREEGMVGNRSAFATAALVSTTALGSDSACCRGRHCGVGDQMVHCNDTFRYCCHDNQRGFWCSKFRGCT